MGESRHGLVSEYPVGLFADFLFVAVVRFPAGGPDPRAAEAIVGHRLRGLRQPHSVQVRLQSNPPAPEVGHQARRYRVLYQMRRLTQHYR